MLQSQMNFIVKDILYYWYIVQKEDGNSGIQAHWEGEGLSLVGDPNKTSTTKSSDLITEKPCALCDKKFPNFGSMKRHLKDVHKMSVAEANTILIERFSLDPKKHRINPADVFSMEQDNSTWLSNSRQ